VSCYLGVGVVVSFIDVVDLDACIIRTS